MAAKLLMGEVSLSAIAVYPSSASYLSICGVELTAFSIYRLG
ncbi:hypothetical protein [Nostoc sp.]